MYKDKSVLCIIPARGGSKRLPGKNIKPLAGKPLIAYSIEHAIESKLIDRHIVSTDSSEIAETARQHGGEIPFMRPAELAEDQSTSADVLLHTIKWLKEKEETSYDIIVLLQVTSPLREVNDIDTCIRLLVDEQRDNVFGVKAAHGNYLTITDEMQAIKYPVTPDESVSINAIYTINGAIYVWWSKSLSQNLLFKQNTRAYIMPPERSIDIDTAFDFQFAEMLLNQNENHD